MDNHSVDNASVNLFTEDIDFDINIHFKLKETVSVGRISRERY